jgi:hypothetical protein
VEHIFGVLKRCFKILVVPPELSLNIQVRIPLALAAIHNFIRKHNPDELEELLEAEMEREVEGTYDEGDLADGPPTEAARGRMNRKRDEIAQDMWVAYQVELRRRAALE